MRKVVASLFVSLDGVMEAPERWHLPYFNEEMGAVIGEALSTTDAFLLGRRTYEEWAAYWPDQPVDENPMAAAINGLPKYVASTTLDEVTWQNSTLLGEDFAGEVSKLKQQPGKDLALFGSPKLTASLIEQGLVDELRVMVQPILLGAGKSLFAALSRRVPVELQRTTLFHSGNVLLVYRPVG